MSVWSIELQEEKVGFGEAAEVRLVPVKHNKFRPNYGKKKKGKKEELEGFSRIPFPCLSMVLRHETGHLLWLKWSNKPLTPTSVKNCGKFRMVHECDIKTNKDGKKVECKQGEKGERTAHTVFWGEVVEKVGPELCVEIRDHFWDRIYEVMEPYETAAELPEVAEAA